MPNTKINIKIWEKRLIIISERFSLDSGTDTSHTNGNSRLKIKEKEPELIILDQVLNLGADWLEISGEPITVEDYRKLQLKGYATLPPEGLIPDSTNGDNSGRIFSDWAEYQVDAEIRLADRKVQQETELKAIRAKIQAGLDDGSLPPELPYETEQYLIDNPDPDQKKLPRIRLTDRAANETTMFKRYFTFLLTKHLLERYSQSDSSQDRITSIAMGYFAENMTPTPGLISSIRNSATVLTGDDILRKIDDLGYHEYIFPGSREADLYSLLKLARGEYYTDKIRRDRNLAKAQTPKPPSEYYYKPECRSIAVLGKNEAYELGENGGKLYLETLHALGRISLYNSGFQIGASLVPIRELLTGEPLGTEMSQKNKVDKYTEWDNATYISYGKLLLSILANSEAIDETSIDHHVFTQAFRLGIGPSIRNIKNRFGSSANYYDAIGAYTAHREGAYTEWTDDDFIKYGLATHQSLPPERQTGLNRSDFIEAYRNGMGPHPNRIERRFGSFMDFLDRLNLDLSSRKKHKFRGWTEDDFISHLQSVGEEIGRRPTEDILWERIHSGKDEPSPEVMSSRVEGDRGLGRLIEKAGWPIIRSWQEEDYMEWAVLCMIANGGKPLTQKFIDFISKKEIGPSNVATRNQFGKLSIFQARALEAYEKYKCRDENNYPAKSERVVVSIDQLRTAMDEYSQIAA